MKKGFTLMELLVVIVIVAAIGVSSVLVFGNIDDSTAIQDRINLYKDIQRSAILYIDMNDTWLEQFRVNGEMSPRISSLVNDGLIDEDLEDPVTGDLLPGSYIVKIYTAKDATGNEYLDTCILDSDVTSAIFCNDKLRKCCTPEDKLANAENCNDGTAAGISETEEQECMDKPWECACYSKKVCNIESCVANAEGDPYECCTNAN